MMEPQSVQNTTRGAAPAEEEAAAMLDGVRKWMVFFDVVDGVFDHVE